MGEANQQPAVPPLVVPRIKSLKRPRSQFGDEAELNKSTNQTNKKYKVTEVDPTICSPAIPHSIPPDTFNIFKMALKHQIEFLKCQDVSSNHAFNLIMSKIKSSHLAHQPVYVHQSDLVHSKSKFADVDSDTLLAAFAIRNELVELCSNGLSLHRAIQCIATRLEDIPIDPSLQASPLFCEQLQPSLDNNNYSIDEEKTIPQSHVNERSFNESCLENQDNADDKHEENLERSNPMLPSRAGFDFFGNRWHPDSPHSFGSNDNPEMAYLSLLQSISEIGSGNNERQALQSLQESLERINPDIVMPVPIHSHSSRRFENDDTNFNGSTEESNLQALTLRRRHQPQAGTLSRPRSLTQSPSHSFFSHRPLSPMRQPQRSTSAINHTLLNLWTEPGFADPGEDDLQSSLWFVDSALRCKRPRNGGDLENSDGSEDCTTDEMAPPIAKRRKPPLGDDDSHQDIDGRNS